MVHATVPKLQFTFGSFILLHFKDKVQKTVNVENKQHISDIIFLWLVGTTQPYAYHFITEQFSDW